MWFVPCALVSVPSTPLGDFGAGLLRSKQLCLSLCVPVPASTDGQPGRLLLADIYVVREGYGSEDHVLCSFVVLIQRLVVLICFLSQL